MVSGDGLGQLRLGKKEFAEVDVGLLGLFWIDFDGLEEGGFRVGQLPLGRQGEAEAVVGGVGVFRIDFDGVVVGVHGLGQLPLFLQGVAEVAVGRGVSRSDFGGLAQQRDSLVEIVGFL